MPPVNSFLLFSNENRKTLQRQNPLLDNTEISSLLGQKWRRLSSGEKLAYKEKAAALRRDFDLAHPNYKKTAKQETPYITTFRLSKPSLTIQKSTVPPQLDVPQVRLPPFTTQCITEFKSKSDIQQSNNFSSMGFSAPVNYVSNNSRLPLTCSPNHILPNVQNI